MAEAILFGHRSLAPIIDLQEQLAREIGKAKRIPYLEPGIDSVLTFLDEMAAKKPFVVFDVETTSRDAKIGSLVEIAAVKVHGGRIADRWSTLVDPGQPIVGHQLHGLTDKDVKGAPAPAEAARQFLAWAGDATLVGHNVGFDMGFLEAALGDGTRIEQGRYLDTLTLAREAWPDQDVFKLADLTAFFGLEPDRPTGPCPMPRPPRSSCSCWPRTCRCEPTRSRRPSPRPSTPAPRAPRRQRPTRPSTRPAAPRGSSKSLTTLLHKKTVRQLVLTEGVRMDGRDLDTIRPITVEVGLLPRAHGSALFTRGDTQALTVATLGPSSDVQRIDTISPEISKRYIHHYNMPPYSTGENKPMRGPGRREIGHGALAERALIPVLPSERDFPYVIRLVSECVTSNGSTSMASTCGSTLALMDAGVPITAPVAGAAMGLVSEADGKFAVLTDILGKEDAFGDMDFKVTGTRVGITALQMDIKVQGINEAIIRTGLEKARVARLAILDKMVAIIPEARTDVSSFAPRITTIKINPEKIREIIGKGGSIDPAHPGGDGHRDQRRGRRLGGGRRGQPGQRQEGDRVDREPDPRGRGRRPVHRQGDPPHELRRVRRDPARQGGPRPHRRTGRLPRADRRGRRVRG